jgi:hypothetical protein
MTGRFRETKTVIIILMCVVFASAFDGSDFDQHYDDGVVPMADEWGETLFREEEETTEMIPGVTTGVLEETGALTSSDNNNNSMSSAGNNNNYEQPPIMLDGAAAGCSAGQYTRATL